MNIYHLSKRPSLLRNYQTCERDRSDCKRIRFCTSIDRQRAGGPATFENLCFNFLDNLFLCSKSQNFQVFSRVLNRF